MVSHSDYSMDLLWDPDCPYLMVYWKDKHMALFWDHDWPYLLVHLKKGSSVDLLLGLLVGNSDKNISWFLSGKKCLCWCYCWLFCWDFFVTSDGMVNGLCLGIPVGLVLRNYE